MVGTVAVVGIVVAVVPRVEVALEAPLLAAKVLGELNESCVAVDWNGDKNDDESPFVCV